MSSSPVSEQRLRDLALLRRVRDRIDREYAAFERLQASDNVEVVREPTEQPYGVRDCAVRDPAGNLLRIQELR